MCLRTVRLVHRMCQQQRNGASKAVTRFTGV
jgi:hypothetical protein